jgi:hypothetical protein
MRYMTIEYSLIPPEIFILYACGLRYRVCYYGNTDKYIMSDVQRDTS